MEKRELAPHPISTKLATLSALFTYFGDYGVINRNPATTKLVPRPAQLLQSSKGRDLSVKDARCVL